MSYSNNSGNGYRNGPDGNGSGNGNGYRHGQDGTQGNPGNPGSNQNVYVTASGGGRNAPKQIHVAHRRSQSELTTLMIEQFTLQKQLELVQQQQQQLLQQQQQNLAKQAGGYYAGAPPSAATGFMQPPGLPQPQQMQSGGGNRSRTHSRNNSGYYQNNTFDVLSNDPPSQPQQPQQQQQQHRRTGSSSSGVYGHSRRQSLGLNEAKKAAAEEQAKRTGNHGQGASVDIRIERPVGEEAAVANSGDASSSEQSSFKFPAAPAPAPQQSNLAPPNAFKFPQTATSPQQGAANNDDDFIQTSSTHRRSRTRNNNEHSPGINSNWRNQSQGPPQGGHGHGHGHGYSNSHSQLQPQQSPYRQGHGHQKSGSRDYNSFSALEPPPFFQGHKHRSSNSSAFNSFSSNNGNQGGRKSLFAPYLPQANIPQLIEEGKLVAGILRVNKKNRSDAWVSTDGSLDADIYICGSKDRNRALEGDLVAVELLVVDEVWGSKKEKEEKKRRKDASMQQDIVRLNASDDYHNDASANSSNAAELTSSSSSNANTANTAAAAAASSPSGSQDKNSDDHIISTAGMSTLSRGSNAGEDGQSPSIKRRGSLKQRPTQKKNDDVEVEGQSLLLVEEEEINDKFKPLYAGHVVAVLDRIPGQLFSGTLGLLRPSQQAQQRNNKDDNGNNKDDKDGGNNHRSSQPPKIAWFKPTDKKVPLIAIPTELAPKGFVENAADYADKLFVASIKRWPITSLHPFGILVSELGEINDPNTEIDSILRDNNFLSNEYVDSKDPTTERSVFQATPVAADNMANRVMFDETHDYNVIAVTFNGALSEFAIHVKHDRENNTIELGCHITDATEQIEANSSLDKRARKRSTGVFMPQKTVSLLPVAVNETLTLAAGKTSPTISVVYALDADTLAVKSTWFGESTVVPTALKTLDDIETEIDSTPEFNLWRNIATAFYRTRINSTTATLEPAMSLFEYLDDEKVDVDLNLFTRSPGFLIVSELQHKVNTSVAEKLYSKLGDNAFLRRQAYPIATKLQSFQNKVNKFGYNIDVTTADTVINSILDIQDADARKGIEILLFKTLARAKYFVAGKVDPDQYGHYALNLPIYTHFTSPLRRYADHVAHKQLKAIINNIPYEEDIEALKITAEYCNFKKDCAFQAQEQAVHLLLCKTINDMGNATGQLLTMATVLQVYESSFDVFIPEFGIEKRVHGDQLPLFKAEFDGTNKILELNWQPGVDSATFVPADEKNPKSYRNSIRNKYKSTTAEIANHEYDSVVHGGKSLASDELAAELSRLHLSVPQLKLAPATSDSTDALDYFISTTKRRREKDNCIQEIAELQKVPVLLRAEIGMALPCLSVRALNPFIKRGNE